jgi:SAM-dependent methyltransferase
VGNERVEIVYRITDEEIQAVQAEYKKKYKPFKPFVATHSELAKVSKSFQVLIETQNGQDTDDYCIADNNKVEKYLSNIPKGRKTLLLGVGTGRETLVAKELGLDAVGTTLGSRNIEFGIEYLGLSPSEHLECLNETLPFDNDTFDVVAGFQVFEHAMSPFIFLLEQNRVLKPGGKLILEWPPGDQFSMEDNPHHQICYSPGQAYALFQKAGFTDIKLYYDDMSPIMEESMWSGHHNKMLCIEGMRAPINKRYIHLYRNLKG